MPAPSSSTTPPADAHPRPRWLDVALLVVFGLGIALPGLGTLTRLDETDCPSEKRALATWPSYEGDAVAWRNQVQAFCDDRFAGREPLIQRHSKFHLDYLVTPPISEVVLGREGWMYYGDTTPGGLRGLRPLNAERLDAWVKVLDGRQRWAKALGARYVLLIGPDKHTIYPEHLPAGYALPESSPFDQLLAHLAAERPEIVVLDVRDAVRAAKGSDTLYWPLGTHWTSSGAFVAAQAVVDSARGWCPQLTPLLLSEVDEVEWPEIEKDLADLLASPERFTHPLLGGLVPRPGAPPVLRVEMFADSYGDALLPHLALRFECVDPIPLSDLLRADVPPTALVLDVLVERKFALDFPTLPRRALEDLERIQPAGHFRASPRALITLEGRQLARLSVSPAGAAASTDDGLQLTGSGSATLHLSAAKLGVTSGWAQLEIEVRDVAHRIEIRQPSVLFADVLQPGVHALSFPSYPVVDLRVTASGGAPLAARVRKIELRGE